VRLGQWAHLIFLASKKLVKTLGRVVFFLPACKRPHCGYLNEDGIGGFEKKKWGPKSPKEWKEILDIVCFIDVIMLDFCKSNIIFQFSGIDIF